MSLKNIFYTACLGLMFCCSPAKKEVKPIVDFSECDRFFEAFNKENPEEQKKAVTAYFSDTVNNPGVKALTMGRPINFMVNRLLGFSDYYKNLGIVYEKMKVKLKTDDTFNKYYAAFKKVYPKASTPKIIFTVSALAAGGTINKEAVVAGLEFYGKSLADKSSSFPKSLKSFLFDMNNWSGLMFHEQMHYQQSQLSESVLKPPMNITVLQRCLGEGGADFVSNLFSGFAETLPNYKYGIKHEKAVWLEFKKDIKKQYGNPKNRDVMLKWARPPEPHPVYPPDLLYFVGSQICKHYYEKQTDKALAIETIFQCFSSMEKAEKFLAESGYDDYINHLKDE